MWSAWIPETTIMKDSEAAMLKGFGLAEGTQEKKMMW
jgi:hypothetical protein